MNKLRRWLAGWLPVGLTEWFGVVPVGAKPASAAWKAENLRLWVRSGARCWLGEYVASSSDYLVPEFTLKPGRLEPATLPQQSLLTISLLQGSGRVPLGQRAVALSGEPTRFRGPTIPLGGARLFPHPGRYCLVASLAGQEVAQFSFRLVGRVELSKQVRVTEIKLDAEKLNGQRVPGLKVLRRDEHLALWPSLRIETGIPAPNSLVRCSVQTQQGTTVLGCEEFLLPLDRPSREIKLQRLDLSGGGFRGRTRPTRFLLAVYIAGELKAVKPFLLLPTDRITNREGQLLQDAKELPLDDLEYEQILGTLAIPMPPPQPRRLWR